MHENDQASFRTFSLTPFALDPAFYSRIACFIKAFTVERRRHLSPSRN